jgi:hypothetical protein
MSDEAKAAATEKTRELLLARESVIAAGRRADALLSKRSAQLLELSLVVGVV